MLHGLSGRTKGTHIRSVAGSVDTTVVEEGTGNANRVCDVLVRVVVGLVIWLDWVEVVSIHGVRRMARVFEG